MGISSKSTGETIPMSRILITGAAGFIGSRLISTLRGRHELFGIVRPKPEGERPVGVKWLEHDLSQPLDEVRLPDRVDVIIHLAQSKYFREFPDYSENIFQVNTESTLRLLEYARRAKAKTFVLASSGGIYEHEDKGFKEDEPIATRGSLQFYLDTKLCAEILAENFLPFMKIIIIRFFFVYGPGQRRTMLIPRLLRSVQEGYPIILHGNEGLKINPTYVTDAANAIYQALELKESHKFNIGGPEVLSLREISNQIGAILNKKPLFEVQENIAPQHLVGDIRKMSKFLCPPTVRFRDGIQKYIESLKNEEDQGYLQK